MINPEDDRRTHSPLPEDRKRTIAEKVRGNGLELAPEDVADQAAARKAGVYDRELPVDERDDDLVSAEPPDQRDALLSDVRRNVTKVAP